MYDYGTFADGGAFIVMELVRGEDLRRVLQREGRMEPVRAVRILETVCAENNNDYFSQRLFPVPIADKPDF